MNELNSIIKKFKMNLEGIIIKIKSIIANMDIYYNIINETITRYEKTKIRNYNILSNIKNINDSIEYEIYELRNNYDYGYNLNGLLYLYSEMNEKNEEIEINYFPYNENEDEENEDEENVDDIKNNSKEKERIFGQEFIINNSKKCKIIYDKTEYDLKEYFKDVDIFYNNKDPFSIKLKGINNITNMSFMFCGCISLSSLPDIQNWNTSNVNNMSYIFSGCKSLCSLPGISNWDTKNVNDMTSMFCGCISLSSLPDISKWNTKNVQYMIGMFYDCKSLLSLPNISKWDNSSIKDISLMFDGCNESLIIPSKFKSLFKSN